MRRPIVVLALIFVPLMTVAQPGGKGTFAFLDLVSPARIASVGGAYTAVTGDNDINLVMQNPSLLDSAMHNHLALSYVNYFADINYGNLLYARKAGRAGTFAAGIQFLDYGDFTETNELAEVTGSFTASEYLFLASWARPLDTMFTAGASIRFIYSELESYYSNGLAADAALTYHSVKHQLAVSAVLRNAGVQLKTYVPGSREKLPFDARLGFSKRLKHLPFRYIINLTHLHKWDLTYENPDNPEPVTDPLTGEPIKQKKRTGDKIMRHVIVGGEFMPSPNFSVRLGYNYRRRQDLKLEDKVGMIGFSWGFGLRVSKFHLSYGRASYHLAGASNHFSLTTNLSDFISRSDL